MRGGALKVAQFLQDSDHTCSIKLYNPIIKLIKHQNWNKNILNIRISVKQLIRRQNEFKYINN